MRIVRVRARSRKVHSINTAERVCMNTHVGHLLLGKQRLDEGGELGGASDELGTLLGIRDVLHRPVCVCVWVCA
jgi:hypothetical protein